MAKVTLMVTLNDIPVTNKEAAAEKVAAAFEEFPNMIGEMGLAWLNGITLRDSEGNETGSVRVFLEHPTHERQPVR